MKNLSLLVIGLIISFSAFSQEKMNISICEKPVGSVHLNHLLECKMLTVNNPAYKVFSFKVGFKSGKDFIEVKMSDNVLSEKIIDRIKLDNPTEIFIDDVVLINKKGEKSKTDSFKLLK
ncbi:MAG: hypothetical protein AB7O47_11005 [Flavobacteriales bacterium]